MTKSKKMVEKVVETDVLVIGGGLAGLMAAIKASESGLRVTLVDKANTKRSGCVGTGIDHYWAYIPEIHGKKWTMREMAKGGLVDEEINEVIVKESFNRLLDLESFGIRIRYEDGWGHPELPWEESKPFRMVRKSWRAPINVTFDGAEIKPVLTREAVERGVSIINRVMVTELLTQDGCVVGVVGVNTREYEIITFKAKAVVLATGPTIRLYRASNGMDFSANYPPHCTGDGVAMAFRAGAELVNMDWREGSRERARAARAGGLRARYAWRSLVDLASRTVDAHGNYVSPPPIGKFEKRPAPGRYLPISKTMEAGKEPIYQDLTWTTEKMRDYAKWSVANEGFGRALLHSLEIEGIDLKTQLVEQGTYTGFYGGYIRKGGVLVNADCETTIEGLYAAGETGCSSFAATGACVQGWRSGEGAARYAKGKATPTLTDENLRTVEGVRRFCLDAINREKGVTWQEVSLALQNCMEYYAGYVRTEELLRAGLRYLKWLKERALFKAENPHELIHCLEERNLMDVGEISMTALRFRKESRPAMLHYRADYPEQDDENWLVFLATWLEDGQIRVRKTPIKRI